MGGAEDKNVIMNVTSYNNKRNKKKIVRLLID